MYFKRPDNEHFELVAVIGAKVVQQLPNGDYEVELGLGDGTMLTRFYTPVDYDRLMIDPPPVIV